MKGQDRSGLPPVPPGARARLARRRPQLIAHHARTAHDAELHREEANAIVAAYEAEAR